MREENGPVLGASFEMDPAGGAVQTLKPPNHNQRFEGVAFSASGDIIGVVTSDTNAIIFFRRKPDGRFEEAPCGKIGGSWSGLEYPHDLSFSPAGGAERLAVAQRAGSIAIYEKNKVDDRYGAPPAFTICGPGAKLNSSDGVSYVPPGDDYLAACNLANDTITFYRKTPDPAVKYRLKPDFELKHPSLRHPDGLAFSRCGTWLAVANHGNHTVSIFERGRRLFFKSRIKYGPEPVTVIAGPELRYPHSVAFSPETNHLVVTNAGAAYFSVYPPVRQGGKTRWAQSPSLRKTVAAEGVFREVNAANKMEGGPKGVAIHGNTVAVCSPEFGIKIFAFREKSFSQAHPGLRLKT